MDNTTKQTDPVVLAERLAAAEAALVKIGQMVSPWAIIDDYRATTREIGKIVSDYQHPHQTTQQ